MVPKKKTSCPGCRGLEEENARLKALLTKHGIAWEEVSETVPLYSAVATEPTTPSTTADKITLFRKLFRGRLDVYPQRWESAKDRFPFLQKYPDRFRIR
jgi:hypothetical protein